jgi:hypothetical protein
MGYRIVAQVIKRYFFICYIQHILVFYGGTPKLPKPTARQLSLYLRELEARKDAKLLSINSSLLGEALGLTGAQVRKEFATFGPLVNRCWLLNYTAM